MPSPSSAAFVCSAAQRHEQTVLVLQGGGALGAYQAGAFEGFAAAGVAPDWVAGVSIGAINAALIAGNPPERRVARLREFWQRISAPLASAPLPCRRPGVRGPTAGRRRRPRPSASPASSSRAIRSACSPA